ncbi:MAG: TonB-dependent receptor [Opitutaceae bacterium]|nr:TonB-dependent receptor [Opitutaceae bacterium]
MKAIVSSALLMAPLVLCGQGSTRLPEVTVYSSRVANQSPAGTFAMPVSALRYEPRVDIQGRNLAEAQADVTIRGGIFENTGFSVGAVSLLDPQTGHYVAENPIAPALLTAPEVRTGAALAARATNATAGAVAFAWRPVQTAGAGALGVGEFGFRRAELYQGYSSGPSGSAAQRFGADIAVARSESDGVVRFGEHGFERLNFRMQRSDATSQTDLFAGYQAKFFGWPNLYTPFNSNETENLQTVLLVLNHRATFGRGEYFEAGAFHRRNKDDYAFNRFAPVGVVRPFQHKTRVQGAAAGGRWAWGDLAMSVRGEAQRDDLHSTSLTFGRYRARTFTKVAIVPEKTWSETGGATTTLRAGLARDDTNRDGGALAPIAEIAREFPRGELRRAHFSYTRTSQVPTYTALNSNPAAGLFRGNPNLGRQRSHNLELGANGVIAGWAAEGALFWRRDDGLVDWTFRRGVTARTANAVDAEVAGLELTARRSWERVDLVVGYTALAKRADYRGAAVDASFYALNYARHRVTAAITARLGGGVEARMDNVARVQAANILRTVGGRRAVTSSLALAWRPPESRRIELSVQADNLWNEFFQEVPAVPAARRQLSATLAYGW